MQSMREKYLEMTIAMVQHLNREDLENLISAAVSHLRTHPEAIDETDMMEFISYTVCRQHGIWAVWDNGDKELTDAERESASLRQWVEDDGYLVLRDVGGKTETLRRELVNEGYIVLSPEEISYINNQGNTQLEIT